MTNSEVRTRPLDQEQVTTEVLARFRETEPALAWMGMLANLRFARIVHAAVKLGIIDALRTGAQTAHKIAGTTATDEVTLRRLLRALSVAGILVETADDRFDLTPAGVLLARDSKPSFCEALLDFFEPGLVPMDGLVRSVKTGKPAFDERHGIPFYDYMARESPDGGARFDAAMGMGARLRSDALLSGADLSGACMVVDVGGGDGTLLAQVLQANPRLRGVVFEIPQTAARARARLAEIGLATRCEVIEGDFFSSVPSGGDAYVLSFILHNWDDERCTVLLSNCRRSMDRGGVLLIVEQVRVRTTEASIVEYFNLHNLELLSGRERTEAEFREILEWAGFQLTRATQEPESPFSLLVARPLG